MPKQRYSPEFYATLAADSYRSGRLLLPLVFGQLRPRSVIDIGCGSGTWMAAAEDLGVERAVGIDGRWLLGTKPYREELEIIIQDLEQRLDTSEHFDLAICLEVAEHLSAARAETLVADICRVADATFFGAAVPLQPGVHHIHCRWQSYWAALFAEHGRIPIDIVRPRVWGRADVPYWYQQNPLLYLEAEKAAELGYDLTPPAMLDVAHPEMIQFFESPSLRFMLKKLPRAVVRAIRGRMRPAAPSKPKT